MASDSLEEFLEGIEEDGTHECVVDAVAENISKKDGRVWRTFKYVVMDEGSDLEGEEFTEMIQDFSHLTVEDYKELSGEDKRKAKFAIRRKRERLESLGIPEGSVQGFNDWQSLVGKNVNVTIETSSGEKGKFTNVRAVELI